MGVFQNNLMGAAAAAASAGGGEFYSHQIAHSIRNSAAQSGTLKWTAGTPTSRKKMTMSYWVKRYNTSGGSSTNLVYTSGSGGGAYMFWGFSVADFDFQTTGGNWSTGYLTSDNMYRDTSAWYHHVLTFDSTESTQADRLKIYVNGERITSFSVESVTAGIGASEDFSFINQSGIVQAFGGLSGIGHGTEGTDNQLAEIVFNDGQAYGPDSYGETKNGVWIPKDPSGLTFGNNGYYLNFAASGDIGNDVSGNNNDFTVANISAHDVMLDSPTFNSDSNGGNFPAWSPLIKGAVNLSEGNCRMDCTTTGRSAMTSWAIPPGCPTKYYVECLITAKTGYGCIFGLANPDIDLPTSIEADSSMNGFNIVGYWVSDWRTNALVNGIRQGCSSNLGQTVARVMAITIDRVNNQIKCYFDNTLIGNGTISISATQKYHIVCSVSGGSAPEVHLNINAGQDSTGGGDFSAGSETDENGHGSFQYAPPTGFLALCSANLPTADAVDPAQTDDDFPQKLFNTKLYTGTGSSNALTGVGFQPDWTWVKQRNATNDYKITDSTRGVTKSIESNTDVAEATDSNGLTAFGTDGFTVGSDSVYNGSSNTFLGWNWRVNGGSLTTNNVGNQTSYTQTDPSGAFSITKYVGTGNSMTVGHGLSVTPGVTIIKDRDAAVNWMVYTKLIDGSMDYFFLNSGAAQSASGLNGPNSSVWDWQSGSSFSNTASRNYILYSFANIEGYCKTGVYTGNANSDGAFVYTGFSPAWLMIKRANGAESFFAMDNKRSTYNVVENIMQLNGPNGESTTDYDALDFLSNGFKLRLSDAGFNGSEQYTYMAWAENPFQYATAR